MISEKEFFEFLKAILEQSRAQGLDESKIATVIANAIKQREEIVYTSEPVEYHEEVINIPQALYAPPMVDSQTVEFVTMDMPQPLYAPPTIESTTVMVERKEMPQPLYAPPTIPSDDGNSFGPKK